MEADIRELMCYLWDNYLQLYNAEKIFIMGVGYAYIGVKMLLLNRSDASPPGKFWSLRAERNSFNVVPLSSHFKSRHKSRCLAFLGGSLYLYLIAFD